MQAPECPVAQTEEIINGPQDIPNSAIFKPGRKRFDNHGRYGVQHPKAFKDVGQRQTSRTSRGGLDEDPTGYRASEAQDVSIEELQEVTGWQAHSIRGLLSGALPKRHRLNIVSHIDGDGTRRYRIKAEGK